MELLGQTKHCPTIDLVMGGRVSATVSQPGTIDQRIAGPQYLTPVTLGR
jgi:hypothetical protein